MQEYPEELLPKSFYKLKIELANTSLEKLTLIRRSLVSQEETTTDLGTVRSHAFIDPDKEHLFYNLSSNLLGVFKKEHLIFKVDKENGGKYWLSKERILPKDSVTFSIQQSSCAIYLNVAKIHDQPYHYTKTNPNGKIERFTGKCKIVHKPLDANYWHFEVEVTEPDGKTIKPKSGSDWRIVAVTSFLESYLKRHLSTVDVLTQLPEDIYTEEAGN